MKIVPPLLVMEGHKSNLAKLCIRPKKPIVSGLRARYFQTSASMFFLI